MKKITVKTNEENPEPIEIIAQAILDIAAGMERINRSRLNRTALVVLLKAQTGLSAGNIHQVLNALNDLKKTYTKLTP